MNSDEKTRPGLPDGADDPANGLALISWIQQFAPYGIITLDPAFRIQIWNHWMEAHSSMSLDQVAGQNLLALFPDLQNRGLVSHLERALRGEPSVLSTSLHRYLLPLASPLRGAGTEFMRQTARIAPLMAHGTLCGIVIVIEDVTQRETQAESLRQQLRGDEILSWALAHFLKTEEPRKTVRQLFFKIAEYLDFDTFCLYLRDIDTGILAVHTMGGFSTEVEKELADNPVLAEIAKLPETIIFQPATKPPAREFALLKKAGITAAIAIPLFANDRSLGLLFFGSVSRPQIAGAESELLSTIAQYLAISIDRENTRLQLQKAREELSNHAQLLEKKVGERTARLEETVSELETLSYTIAHDLKAPVRGMIGYCEVLLEDFGSSLPEDARLIVERMARNPIRMEALIKDLLQFSQISRQEIVLAEVDVEPIIEDISAMRIPEVRRAISIRGPLLPVRTHKALLRQVLSNLVDNAIKFVSPQTSPKVIVSTEAVFHTSPSTRSGTLLFSSGGPMAGAAESSLMAERQNGIRIWIRDEGIGIPLESHKKIFGIFERGAFAKNYEGTGIGLAIVARAMQRMGGTCGVESREGQGSRFWLEFPGA